MSYNTITISASKKYKGSGDTNFDGVLWSTYIHDVQSCIRFIKGIFFSFSSYCLLHGLSYIYTCDCICTIRKFGALEI